ncbi:RCC1 domain-containing protein [Pararhodobacter sp. CCB-MM2]|uniref:RCC1 domain-containing protein n=1 Tax=Pararhodobacter sp. CCB-MM2 TaxID=1786003 RepID=UPI0009F28EE5|nr:RCC1 domain-containing protein [Pararhodobacter sp. CCB-MM2]
MQRGTKGIARSGQSSFDHGRVFLAILEAVLRLSLLALLSAALFSSPTFAQSPTSTALRVVPEVVSPNTALELHAIVSSPDDAPTGSVVFRRGAREIGRAELTASEYPFGQLSVGGGHVCSIDAGGQVFCWGRNNWGQLGNAG